MSGTTYFVQDCPTCGRMLQVRLELLGRDVVCEHCNGAFQAADPALQGASTDSAQLLHRVDELLAAAETPLTRTPHQTLWHRGRALDSDADPTDMILD